MTKRAKIIAIFLVACLAFSFSIPALTEEDSFFFIRDEQETSALLTDRAYFSGGSTMSGIVVESRDNLTYPSADVGFWSLSSEAEQVVSDAAALSMDTIFYPVTPDMGSMYHSRYLPQSRYMAGETGGYTLKDPLKTLVKQSEAQDISVCAVISPFGLGSIDYNNEHQTLASEHPEWLKESSTMMYLDPSNEEVQELIGDIAGELTRNYKIQGVVLDFSTSMETAGATLEDLQNTILSVARAVRDRSSSTRIGIILPGDLLQGEQSEQALALLQNAGERGMIDFVLPQIHDTVSDGNTYANTVSLWQSALQSCPRLQMFVWQDASRIRAPLSEAAFYADDQEILFQQFYNQINGVGGSVVSSLYNVMMSPELFENLRFPQNSSDWYSDPALERPELLTIGTPTGILSTDQNTVTITGICDPSQTLYLDDGEYQGEYGEITPSGCFSLELPLKMGLNRFVFTQSDRVRTVLARRSTSIEEKQLPISSMQEDSLFPQYSQPVWINEPLIVSCSAPSGAQIIALIDDQQYELTQLDPSIPKGYPAAYQAQIPLPENVFEVTNLGHVSYSMVYNDRLSYQTSPGEIFLLAEQQELVVQVTDPIAPVHSDASEQEVLYTLTQGTKDYVVKSGTEHFYLQSGGCIPKSSVKVLTSATDIYTVSKRISNVIVQSTSRGEYITFAGGSELPCSVTYDEENRTVTLQLSHVLDIPLQLDYLQSDLFEDIQVTRDNTSVTMQLTLKENMPFYGYQVTFTENNMVVYFRSHFSDSNAQSPLDGVNIVIDPGHGGSDTGLLGLLEGSGPNEETLNLALANALYDRLHALGANVYLTRSNHSAMAGLDRVMFAQYREADLFLSIHQCTSDEPGIHISYNNPFSAQLAQRISDGLSARLQRPQQETTLSNSYLAAVTLMPAVSIDLGSLSNASDYGSISDPVDIYRSAYQIAQDLEQFLEDAQQEYTDAVAQAQTDTE